MGLPLGCGSQPGVQSRNQAPLLGGNTAWEEARRGVSPPMAPPIYIPIGVLVSFASKFTSILELDCMYVDHCISIFLHVVNKTCIRRVKIDIVSEIV